MASDKGPERIILVEEKWGREGKNHKELALAFAHCLSLWSYEGKIVGIPEWKIIDDFECGKRLIWMCSVWRPVGQ